MIFLFHSWDMLVPRRATIAITKAAATKTTIMLMII